MKIWKAALAALAMVMGSTPAWAVYVINVTENATGVTITGSGSLDLAALTRVNTTATGNSYIDPTRAVITIGAGSYDLYTGVTAGLSNFGAGSFAAATSANGAFLGIAAADRQLAIRQGYVSGQELGTSVAFFAGATIDGLGLRRQGYGIALGTPDNQLQINVGNPVNGVPEPASWAMMIAGFAVVGAAARGSRAAAPHGATGS